jgi:hypothetical protein
MRSVLKKQSKLLKRKLSNFKGIYEKPRQSCRGFFMEKSQLFIFISKPIFMKLPILSLFALILFSACSNDSIKVKDPSSVSSSLFKQSAMGSKDYEEATEAVVDIAAPPTTSSPSRVEATVESKIIYTADVKMQVDKLADASQKLKVLVAENKGYLASDNQSQNDYDLSRTFTIRVPAPAFDTLLNQLVTAGVFLDYKNVRAEDVTSQYVDVATRLKNKQALEQQYLAILKQATRVTDILEVQTQLSQVREDIDAQMAQLKLLQDQVSYSTINMELYQRLEFKARPKESFLSQLAEAFTNGFVNFKYFLINTVSLWPFAILVLGVVFFVKWWRKRKK